MKQTSLKANILMLITAAVWGFAFVAQKKGMDHVGPFAFNASRFFIGVISLIPVLWFFRRHKKKESKKKKVKRKESTKSSSMFIDSSTIKVSVILGAVLFGGAALQQIGMVYTTAGKAGFITGIYVLLVPLFGLFVARKVSKQTWIAVLIALYGLYLLSVKSDAKNFWSLEFGDLLVLCSTVFWAIHILLVDRFVEKHDALELSITQFFFCGVFSLIVALIVESTTLEALLAAKWSILYAGCFSTAVGYTLQVVAQKEAHPTHAAIILSMEGVFAAIGGWLLLSEFMSGRMLLGCCLILVAMLLAQLKPNTLKP